MEKEIFRRCRLSAQTGPGTSQGLPEPFQGFPYLKNTVRTLPLQKQTTCGIVFEGGLVHS